MRWIPRTSLLALLGVVLVATCGCSKGYYYQLKCVVRSAADGKPLKGVKAVVDTFGHKEDFSYGDKLDEPSDTDGILGYKLYVSMGSSAFREPHWYLKLEKEGFEAEVVDIKPGPEPDKAGITIPIFVNVTMRPKAPGK